MTQRPLIPAAETKQVYDIRYWGELPFFPSLPDYVLTVVREPVSARQTSGGSAKAVAVDSFSKLPAGFSPKL